MKSMKNESESFKLHDNLQTPTSPLKAIRVYCLHCCMESPQEVARCVFKDCPLFNFRKGHNPYSKKNLSEEQREKLRARMAKMRNF